METSPIALVHPAASPVPFSSSHVVSGLAEWLGHGGVEVGYEGLDPLLQVLLGGEVAAAQQLAHQREARRHHRTGWCVGSCGTQPGSLASSFGSYRGDGQRADGQDGDSNAGDGRRSARAA